MLTILMLIATFFYGLVPAISHFGVVTLLIPTQIDLLIGAIIFTTWNTGDYKMTLREMVTYIALFGLSWGLYLKILLTPLPKPLYLQKQQSR